MKKSILTLLGLGVFTLAMAQTPPVAAPPAADENPPTAKDLVPMKVCTQPGFGLGVNLSSNGYGLNLARTLNKSGNLILVLDYKTMNTSIKDYAYVVSGQTLLINADVTLGHLAGFIDWHPFKNSVKIKAGYAILKTGVDVKAGMRDSTKQGIIMMAPSEVGDITTGITFKPSVYLGLGFGRAVPKKRVGFTFELGGYYVGKPDVKFATTGMLEPTSANEPKIQDDLSGLSWLPYLNMSLNFRLGKLNK